MKTQLKGRILTASQARKLERNTIWILTCKVNGRSRFLGSYPSHEEAEQAGKEGFSHYHKQLDVCGYAPTLLRHIHLGKD